LDFFKKGNVNLSTAISTPPLQKQFTAETGIGKGTVWYTRSCL